MDLREKVVSTLSDPGRGGIKGLLDLSQSISANRKTALEAFEIISTWTRDLLMKNAGFDVTSMIHVDLDERLEYSAELHSSDDLMSVYEETVKAVELLEAPINVKPGLITDVALLKIVKILAGPTYGVGAAGKLEDRSS
jgi:hypothetical protein